MEIEPTKTMPPNDRFRWFQIRFGIAVVGGIAVLAGVGGYFLGRIRPGGESGWKSVQTNEAFAWPLQDASGNTAFVHEPVNSIIIMTEPRPSVVVSPINTDDEGRPTFAWGVSPNATKLSFIRNTLLIRLPDGKEGMFQLRPNAAKKFADGYNHPESGVANSLVQKAVNLYDDPPGRLKVEKFLGGFRGQDVERSR
jgi:hypothetical protein